MFNYVIETPETIKGTADMINRYPDRFLFGMDVVTPKSLDDMVVVYDTYAGLRDALTPEASAKVRKGNYERLFDNALRKGMGATKRH